MITLERYISDLEQTLSRYFDVARHPSVADRFFLLSARHSLTMGRTLITNKDVIDKYEVHRIILVQGAESMNHVLDLSRWLKDHIREIVQPNSERYLTLVNLVLIFGKPVPDDIKEFVNSYALTKSFLFSLLGWAQAGMTCVCLQNGDVFCGKKVLEMKQLFDPSQNHDPPNSNPPQTQTDQSVVKYT